jgi:hypothetical protein
VQVQTEIAGGVPRYATRLASDHREFLLALSRLDQGEGRLEDWPPWPAIWDWSQGNGLRAGADRESLKQAAETCVAELAGRSISFHRVHGDFAPWHALSGSRGLAVIDWEESEAQGLPFMDALRFVLSREFHLNGRKPNLTEILSRSPFSLGQGDELQDMAAVLGVSPEIARLSLLAELYQHRNFWSK